jgi:CPA2 family monovalent cation:H+ antiporter-2
MHDAGLLPQLVFASVVALAALLIASRLRVPAVVALIVTGIVVGPSALAVVPTREDVEMLAEIGVVLLMFTVGLEFSFVSLKPMLRIALVGGALQIVLTTAAGLAVSRLADPNLRIALFVGLFVTLTSTAILLKELAARNTVASPHGRLIIAVLLLQDIAAIVAIAMLPVLAGQRSDSVLWALARIALAAGGATAVGWFVLPRLIHLVTPNRDREAFSLGVVVASLGTAWAASQLGLSMALGAFLAGLVLADSEFTHQIHAEVRPLRDVLTSLFFISVGMIIELPAIVQRLPLVLGAALLVLVVKSCTSSLALLLARVPVRPAVIAGISLVPIGEFSFVMAKSALELGLLSTEVWQLLLGTSVLTMIAAPTIVGFAPELGQRFAGRFARHADPETEPAVEVRNHVVVLGFGVGGRLIARALRELEFPYVVVELNGATVREGVSLGEPIMYGDVTSPDALRAAGVDRARAVVALLSDPDATLRAVRAARSVAPLVPILARARYRTEADRLQHAGATLAVAEELEASLEVLAQLLMSMGIPGNALELLLAAFRRESTGARPLRAPNLPLMNVPEAIQRSPVATHRLEAGDWAVGRTLADVALRTSTGATVLAVQMGDRYITSPPASQMLEAGQVLYLMGDASDMLLARARLTDGPRDKDARPA